MTKMKPMVLYEIKLVSQENEVVFMSVNKSIVLPTSDIYQKFPKSTLHITTLDSNTTKPEVIGLLDIKAAA